MLYNYSMKIGIYGGTFDPVHNGHICIAKAVMKELGLDYVYFVVTADAPHKLTREHIGGDMRLKMVQLSIDGWEGLEASDVELRRGGVSYTLDTIREFKRSFADAELYFIVGGDMLADFPTWHCPGEILKLATLVAVKRPNTVESYTELADKITAELGGRVMVTQASGPDISSTEVRRRVLCAEPIEHMVPFGAEMCIYENLLYMPEDIKQIASRLASVLDTYRMRHTMLTVREAVGLASCYGIDGRKARLAAILHDCVKLGGKETIEFAAGRGFELTDEEIANPYLIHSRLGAVIARCDYGVQDDDVINAIDRHTLGSENMTELDKIIYLADKLEPSRKYRHVGKFRKLAYTNLNQAVVAVMKHTIGFIHASGREVNPATLRAIASLERS